VKKDKGAGIGLLLVKSFIERHGGDICFESVEGKGSSFYFTLPKDKLIENSDKVNEMEYDESA